MKKLLSLLLVMLMAFSSAAFCFADEPAMDILIAPAPTTAAADDIVIMHTNDAHCGYLPYDKLATAAKDADLLVDSGDAIQGDVIGTLSKGEYIVDIMNYLGYDVATFGNHEFDYGMDQLNTLLAKANAKYVCCNLVKLEDGTSLHDAYTMVEVKGKKLAFVGITTPETFVKSTPTYFQDAKGNYIYGFCEGNNGKDLYDACQKAFDAAKADGADYVIALAHLGIDEESQPWTVKDVVSNTNGVDIVLDGHSHSVYTEKMANKDGKEVDVQQTGTKVANAGKVIIKADGTIACENVDLANVEADAAATEFIAGITAKFDELQNQVVAKSEINLSTKDENGKRAVRNQETAIGDLCADAYRYMMGADIAFVNGGGIRADINAGDITFGNIVSVHPFGNVACLVEVTGQQILDALELGYSKVPNELGGFLQVSGITLKINTAIPSSVVLNDKSEFVKVDGERRVYDVMVGDAPIDPAKTYKLASHNYMLKSCGDGYAMFGKDNITLLRDETLIDNQVLINYIVDYLDGTITSQYAKPQGRITIVEAPAVEIVEEPVVVAPVVVEPAKEEAKTEEGTYTVKAGDNLSKLAEKFYGSLKKWKVLFELNKSIIKNPNLIYINQILKY